MTIKNGRLTPIKTYITNVECMYDDGEQGSDLSLFDDAEINGNASLPANDGRQYIEVKGSGSCFFDNSTFNVKVEDATNNIVIGTASFVEDDNSWSGSSDNTDLIDVYVNNSGDQAVIRITVEAN